MVEKEGFKEIHIIKDGRAIQKYSVRVYPDGREVSVDDEFAVVGLDQVSSGRGGRACITAQVLQLCTSQSTFQHQSIGAVSLSMKGK